MRLGWATMNYDIERTKLKFGERSFAVSRSRTWNTLPEHSGGWSKFGWWWLLTHPLCFVHDFKLVLLFFLGMTLNLSLVVLTFTKLFQNSMWIFLGEPLCEVICGFYAHLEPKNFQLSLSDTDSNNILNSSINKTRTLNFKGSSVMIFHFEKRQQTPEREREREQEEREKERERKRNFKNKMLTKVA